MEKVMELLANVTIESESAVKIAMWIVTMKSLGTILSILAFFTGIAIIIKQIYNIFDRITEKPKGKK